MLHEIKVDCSVFVTDQEFDALKGLNSSVNLYKTSDMGDLLIDMAMEYTRKILKIDKEGVKVVWLEI